MAQDSFDVQRNSPYSSTTHIVELGDDAELIIIQEFHDLDHYERMDREAIFLGGRGVVDAMGMDIAHTYQPRDFRTGRFAKRVQIFGA